MDNNDIFPLVDSCSTEDNFLVNLPDMLPHETNFSTDIKYIIVNGIIIIKP